MDDSKRGHGGVLGQSPTGNFQQALDDAVGQLGHGVEWRLESVTGTVGGVAGNHLTVHLQPVEKHGPR